MQSRAITFVEPQKARLGVVEIPEPDTGEMVIRTLYSGISTGTETRVFSGRQEGGTFPLIPGYENVGKVVATGNGIGWGQDSLVYSSGSLATGPYHRCWGGHMEYSLVKADSVLPLPAGTTPRTALYTTVGAIALHGMKRARIKPGETVAIVGLGLIGQWAVQTAKASGTTVIGVDLSPTRLEIAALGGADYTIQADLEDVEARVKEISGGGVDVAVDVTGRSRTVDGTARLVRSKPWSSCYFSSARVVILGSYAEPVPFTYQPTLFDNEPDILPSRHCTKEDQVELLGLIASRRVRPEVIPETIYPFEAASQAYGDLIGKQLMRVIFDWRVE
jgi:bacteriochlorophyllide a dehydrogenase